MIVSLSDDVDSSEVAVLVDQLEKEDFAEGCFVSVVESLGDAGIEQIYVRLPNASHGVLLLAAAINEEVVSWAIEALKRSLSLGGGGLSTIRTKQAGKCPFCDQQVAAVIVESNTVRRDRCQCPSCGEHIYLCRVPGCNDYAKGTSIYDHELCPSCTTKLENAASVGGKFALDVAKQLLIAVIAGKAGLSKKAR